MSFQQRAMSCLLVVALTASIPFVKATDTSLNPDYQAEPLDADTGKHRLPRDVFPTKYTIRIEPNIVPDQFTFKGETEIEIDIPRGTSMIVLHVANLNIDKYLTRLLYANASRVNVAITPAYDVETNFYKLRLSEFIPSGHYILKMKYSGLLHNDKRGFYREYYLNHQGQKVWFATTQFEPADARRAFPCFDEPSFKATFRIFITHSNTYQAISNMPVVNETTPNNDVTKLMTEFRETPKMSTFLVAFCISDFHYFSMFNGKFRIFARNDILHLTEYAEMMGPAVLEKLATYTRMNYMLPKMDNLLIPRFNHPGMENWGLVVYRESALLYDETLNTVEDKHKIVTLLSHEFAHQWFGNLVTPSWWSSIWLSEGFATYFEYLIPHKVKASWRMMDRFVTEILQKKAFTVDDDEAQAPMEITTTLNDTNKIFKIAFNGVAYSKASCVIRMFEHVLTLDDFRSGLHNYLTTKSYKAVTSGDLIRELVAVRRDIKFLEKALASWFTQPGYPVITVIRNYITDNAVISQKRFLTNSSKVRTEQWFVPINVVSAEEPKKFSNTEPTHWLLNDTKTLTLSGLNNYNWIILNSQQTGYYRVNYDAYNWKLIINYLKNPNTMKNIHVLNRAQLLDDSWHLAEATELPDHSTFLEITNYLQHEDDYIPWYTAHRAFAVLNKALMNTACYDLYKLYIQRLTANLEEKLGYTENYYDKDIMKLNRLNVIILACAMGSAKCLAATRQMMRAHVHENNKTSANSQRVVLCAGMRSANETEWEMAYNYTINLNSDSEEYRILVNALGCSSDYKNLKMYLKKTLRKESKINSNAAFRSVKSGGVAGVAAILSYILEAFEDVVEIHNARGVLLILKGIADKITTQDQISLLQDFVDTLPDEYQELAHNISSSVIDIANENIKDVKLYKDTVTKFLNRQDLVKK